MSDDAAEQIAAVCLAERFDLRAIAQEAAAHASPVRPCRTSAANFMPNDSAVPPVIHAASLAAQLRLPSRGSAGMLRGVTGAATAENFAVASWRAGSVRLPPSMIAAIGSAVAQTGATGTLRGPIGLLGSDVLSRYGKIAIDYDKGLLVLDPPVK